MSKTVRVGQQAPAFELPAIKGDKIAKPNIKLADYTGKWLVLIFYPLDFTHVCPTELIAFSNKYDDFVKVGADILAVSVDSIYAHRAWLQTPRNKNGVHGLRFPLASDLTRKALSDYDVLIEAEGIALRGLFIIDPEGILRYKVVHDQDVGRSTDEIWRVIQALQTGRLCQANWRPGQKPLPDSSDHEPDGQKMG